jgi:hypothetical protein
MEEDLNIDEKYSTTDFEEASTAIDTNERDRMNKIF